MNRGDAFFGFILGWLAGFVALVGLILWIVW